ncbi:MAG: hypothetical protein KDA61_02735 [Planctomycetales bacterium]|nr:hypothetical protein [Planctomycetales bacterium]
MGIPVKCPNGHEFRVKDKYAGKKGVCPFCDGHVVVQVPDALSSTDLRNAYTQAVSEEHRRGRPALGDSSIFESAPDLEDPVAGESSSLLGSSVVRHNIKCTSGESVPMWFAKCPRCGKFLEHF